MPNLKVFGVCTALRVMASPLMLAILTSGLVRTQRMPEMTLRVAPVVKPFGIKTEYVWQNGASENYLPVRS